MYSKIKKELQTTDDLSALKEDIDLLKSALYSSKSKFDFELSQSVSKNIKEAMLSDLGSGEVDKADYLEGLEKEISKFIEVKLYVAYDLDQTSIADFYNWISQQIGDNFILDISYSPGIVGGAILSYKGKYFDGSLRKKIEELKSSNKQ